MTDKIKATINFSITIEAFNMEDLKRRVDLLAMAASEEGAQNVRITPPEGGYTFSARLVALTDTFQSQGTIPIYMLAFSSPDELSRSPQLSDLVRGKNDVRITIAKQVVTL